MSLTYNHQADLRLMHSLSSQAKCCEEGMGIFSGLKKIPSPLPILHYEVQEQYQHHCLILKALTTLLLIKISQPRLVISSLVSTDLISFLSLLPGYRMEEGRKQPLFPYRCPRPPTFSHLVCSLIPAHRDRGSSHCFLCFCISPFHFIQLRNI